MEEETILKKLERLFKMHRLLKEKKLKRIKDKKLKYGQWDWEDEDDEEDDLLSRPELIEEALKEYMYQFGLSIYQNKQGDYYFKKFIDDTDIRDFDELDTHHFALGQREPNFIEKLLETVPENKVHLLDNMETAVLDLYEKDAIMSDILDQMVNEETDKCQDILEHMENTAEAETVYEPEVLTKTEELALEAGLEAELPELALETAENSREIIAEELAEVYQPANETPAAPDEDGGVPPAPAEEKWNETYQCGEQRVEKVVMPKPTRVRRVRRPQSNRWSKTTAMIVERLQHRPFSGSATE